MFEYIFSFVESSGSNISNIFSLFLIANELVRPCLYIMFQTCQDSQTNIFIGNWHT